MKYLIEGFARPVGSIGDVGHVCFPVEASDPDKAVNEAYKTYDTFTRVCGWEGVLIRVTEINE